MTESDLLHQNAARLRLVRAGRQLDQLVRNINAEVVRAIGELPISERPIIGDYMRAAASISTFTSATNRLIDRPASVADHEYAIAFGS